MYAVSQSDKKSVDGDRPYVDERSYYVYLVRCPRGLYCGYTNNPVRRLKQHKGKGGARSVRMLGGAQEMRVVESFGNKSAAMSYEHHIKRDLTKLEKELLWDKSTSGLVET